MKLMQVLSAILLSGTALMSVAVSAQQVPAACTWAIVSTWTNAHSKEVREHCKDNTSSVSFAERRTITDIPGPTTPRSCEMTLFGSVANNGTCLQPILVRTSTACNSGKSVAKACEYTRTRNGWIRGSAGSGWLPDNEFARYVSCGDASCPIVATPIGFTNECKPQSSAQPFDNYFMEFSCL